MQKDLVRHSTSRRRKRSGIERTFGSRTQPLSKLISQLGPALPTLGEKLPPPTRELWGMLSSTGEEASDGIAGVELANKREEMKARQLGQARGKRR
jgi:hypothetical protein